MEQLELELLSDEELIKTTKRGSEIVTSMISDGHSGKDLVLESYVTCVLDLVNRYERKIKPSSEPDNGF